MCGQQVLGLNQLMEAGNAFEARGTAGTVITLKGGGAYYKDGISSGIIKPEENIANANAHGAGNVLSAAVVRGLMEGAGLEESVRQGVSEALEFIRNR